MIKRETRTVNLGVRALAKRIGCSPTMVSYVLSGKRNFDTPMGRRIIRLANKGK
jgi:transcriptional regulator with XRE-family HTH domain